MRAQYEECSACLENVTRHADLVQEITHGPPDRLRSCAILALPTSGPCDEKRMRHLLHFGELIRR